MGRPRLHPDEAALEHGFRDDAGRDRLIPGTGREPQPLRPDRHRHCGAGRTVPDRGQFALSGLDADEATRRPGGAALQEGALAHEGRDETGGGAGVDPLGRAGILDPAGVHDHHEIGERHRLLLVVGDVHEAPAGLALQRLEFVLHLAAEMQVERAERFVEEQDGGLDHQRAGERDPLALAA